MNYYVLDPEVAGGFGPNTIFADLSTRPPRVTRFHYEFDGWSGDPLVTTVCCFIVTESLKEKILALRATGVAFGEVEVSTSSEFEEFCPGVKLPKFVWLQVTGNAGEDDFGMSRIDLVVSQRVLELLKNAGMAHCDIAEFTES